MDEIQNISKRVDALPVDLQRQILDYIEFIISRYQSSQSLTQDSKAFIDQRIQAMKDHPEENLEWDQARKEIHQRLNWELMRTFG